MKRLSFSNECRELENPNQDCASCAYAVEAGLILLNSMQKHLIQFTTFSKIARFLF